MLVGHEHLVVRLPQHIHVHDTRHTQLLLSHSRYVLCIHSVCSMHAADTVCQATGSVSYNAFFDYEFVTPPSTAPFDQGVQASTTATTYARYTASTILSILLLNQNHV